MNNYQLIRTKRKTICLSLTHDMQIQVKAPLRMPQKDITQFVEKHSKWIEKQKTLLAHRTNNVLTPEQIAELTTKAKEQIPQKVEQYSQIMGVSPSTVKITSAKTRWGSCSATNGLCFSYRIMLLPSEIIDAIIVHELAHIRVKNHSAAFYKEIETYQPDYRLRAAKLKTIQYTLPR